MKNYFNTVLPPAIGGSIKGRKYHNVLTRTSINGIFVGHPGIISREQYNRWGNNVNNSIQVCFPFTPFSTNNGHNVVYEMAVRDVVVIGKSHITDVKTIRSHSLSVDTINRVTKQVTDRPIVFEVIGKKQAGKALNSLYRFIEHFKHVRFCSRTINDYVEVHNHSLYIEMYPMDLCIPIYDTKNVNGFGIVINIIGNDCSIVRCIAMLVSKHRDNLFVVDGSTICSETREPTAAKGSLMKSINFHCARTASIHNEKSWSVKTNHKKPTTFVDSTFLPRKKKDNNNNDRHREPIEQYVLSGGVKVDPAALRAPLMSTSGYEFDANPIPHATEMMPKIGEVPIIRSDVSFSITEENMVQEEPIVPSDIEPPLDENILDEDLLEEIPVVLPDKESIYNEIDEITQPPPVYEEETKIIDRTKESIDRSFNVYPGGNLTEAPTYEGVVSATGTGISWSKVSGRGSYRPVGLSDQVVAATADVTGSFTKKKKKKKRSMKKKKEVLMDMYTVPEAF